MLQDHMKSYKNYIKTKLKSYANRANLTFSCRVGRGPWCFYVSPWGPRALKSNERHKLNWPGNDQAWDVVWHLQLQIEAPDLEINIPVSKKHPGILKIVKKTRWELY